MRKNYLRCLGFAAVLLSAGCAVTPVPAIRPAVKAVNQVTVEELAQRNAAFAEATQGLEAKMAVIYPAAYPEENPEEVLKRVLETGFNRVLLVINSEAELCDRLVEFFRSADKLALPAELVIRQRDYFPRSRGDALWRMLSSRYLDLIEVSRKAGEFHEKLKSDGLNGLAGFNVVFEPHMFNAVSGRYSGAGVNFQWSEDTFGLDLDNDVMVKNSFEIFRQLPIAGVPFTPIVADSYHEWAQEGKLSLGKTTDFAALSRPEGRVMILLSGNRPSQTYSNVKAELENTQVMVYPIIMVADHLSVEQGALRRRNWTDLINTLKYFSGKMKDAPHCGGFALGPFPVVDYLRNERE